MTIENQPTSNSPNTPNTPSTTSTTNTPPSSEASGASPFTNIYILLLAVLNLLLMGVAYYDQGYIAVIIVILIGPILNLMCIAVGILGFSRTNPPSSRSPTESQYTFIICAPLGMILIDFFVVLSMNIQFM